MRSLLVRDRGSSRLACLIVFATALLACVLPQVASAEPRPSTELGVSSLEPSSGAEPEEISSTPSTTKRYTPCPSGSGLIAECNLVIDPVPTATPSGYRLPDGAPLIGSGEKGGLDPADLQSAYKLPTTGGSSETVALVDAYGDSTAESDLNKYREKYKVYYKGTETACTKINGCFKKVNVKGEEANYPAAGPEIWGAETALDIEMVSAACPECHILLVEASGEYPAETAAAVEEAAKLKATEISNSYGYSEDDESACPSKKGCKEYLAAYNQGIPVMASAGDGGYDNKNRGYSAPLWPAVSPNVIAVGGTELEKVEKPKEGERGWKEVVWPDSGSGCSLYESEPTWQEAKTVPKACGADRTDNDVASVAEEVSIYTTPYEGGWGNVGGTSASSPFVAGVEAHATSATKKLGADAFYKKPSMLFHISSGSNGSCGAEGSETYYLCHATKEGYNGPTGWGTPDGVFNVNAPTVITGSATSVTATGATLHGTVNPNKLETKYYFEYGTTESYGSKTAEASAGSGESNVEESKAITGLTPGTKYHFRIVGTNAEGTAYGLDQTFTTESTASALASMAVTEPFNGSKSSEEAYSAKWSKFGWVSEKGDETEEGWRPNEGYPVVNGAFDTETLTETGSGMAVVTTMAANPGNSERYFSLWLNATGSSSTRSGYELRFTDSSEGLYNVMLSKWVSGTQTTLASTSNYAFAVRDVLALVYIGGKVSAWVDAGSGFAELLSASDASFEHGNAGIEGAGNRTLLNNFKEGTLSVAESTASALASMAVTEPFNGSKSSEEAYSTKWSKFGWVSEKGDETEEGWRPNEGYPVVNGAFDTETLTETGSGMAVVTTMAANPGNSERYFSLWLNATGSSSTRSGYELRFTDSSEGLYNVMLSKWVSGTQTTLASTSNYAFAVGDVLALVRRGGMASAWVNAGSGFAELLSASDASFEHGNAGIEGAGNRTLLNNFKEGAL